jgi:hypothetical protein
MSFYIDSRGHLALSYLVQGGDELKHVDLSIQEDRFL